MKTILKIKSGSHLYGTSTPESDEDYLWIFIPEEKYYYGLENIKELEQNVVSVGPDWKNTGDAIDCKLYELRHYCKLAMGNNPNMLEMLFVDDDNVVEITPEGQLLRDNAHLFPWEWCISRYLGYATSQEKKMTLKVQNRKELQQAMDRLVVQDPQKRILDCEFPFPKVGNDHFKVWDVMFPVTCKVIQAMNKHIGVRLNQASWRQEMWDKHWYDTKFASHLIRLLLQCEQLLEDRKLSFPIPQYELVRDIKKWEYTLDEVLALSDDIKGRVRLLEENNTLPKKPRYDEINELLIGIVKNSLAK